MSLRVYNTPVIVLHRINLGETDKILTLFTREKGKLSAVARGARKPLSKMPGATELFTHSRMQIAVGRSLDVVTQAEIVNAFSNTRADLARIAYASVITELADRFMEERDPHPEVFSLTLGALGALERESEPDLVAQLFALHLLSGVGYRPHLENCVVGGEELGDGPVAFSPSLGGALCAAHRRRFADALAVRPDTLALAGALLRIGPAEHEALALLATHAPADVRRELDGLLRAHMQYRLERPIKSLDFVREVRAVYAA